MNLSSPTIRRRSSRKKSAPESAGREPAASGARTGDLLAAAARALRGAGVGPARLEAEVLLAAATGWVRSRLMTYPERAVPAAPRRRFEQWMQQRVRDRVPLQYLTRRQEFWSLDLYVDERTLIPRPETECLVEELLRRAGPHPETWIDVGTGSAAVALALAAERPDCRVVGLDISPGALRVAALNCRRHPGPGARVWLMASDLLEAVRSRRGIVNRIAANLPYLSASEIRTLEPEVAAHEPRRALVAGEDGAALILRLLPQAADLLAAGGTLHLEIAPALNAQVAATLRDSGRFSAAEIRRDGLGLERIISAVRLP